MAEKILEKPLLERLKERRAKFRERIRGEKVSGEEERVVGGGRLIEKATKRIDKVTARVKERGLIPAVRETIERWEPGRRVRELIVPIGGEEAHEKPTKREYIKPEEESRLI